MSVPKSNVLSCSRGFLARVNTNLNSPQQNQNVSVVVNPYERSMSVDHIEVKYPDINENTPQAMTERSNEIKERSI